MSDTIEVKKWYNDFSKQQVKTGVNLRHYTIYNELIKYGMQRSSYVLEIGCGIGTLTGLINKYISKGKLVATDISDESIKIAKLNIYSSKKIDFIVSDMIDFKYEEKFDFIVLPDVMEHIPISQHSNLFTSISNNMHDNSIILVHIPHPKALDYIRKYNPELLQVIDQSVSADQLISDAYKNDLQLINYKSYNLFHDKNDYVFVAFKKNKQIKLLRKNKLSIIFNKILQRIKFWKSFL